MTVLSIDQSLSCSGVTIWEDDKLLYFTCLKTSPKQDVLTRIIEITEKLKTLIETYDVKGLVLESLPFGLNSTSVRPLAGLHMCLQKLVYDTGIELFESHVTKTKKLATGKGNAKKEDMLNALLSRDKRTFDTFVSGGYKKTTGLTDLTDSYFLYKLYQKENT